MSHSNSEQTTILLCLDLETDSDRLARFTARFAAQGVKKVHVLYVETRKLNRHRQEKEEVALRQLVGAAMQGVEIAAIEVLEGVPEDAILRYLSDRSIDLIVLGHRQDAIERIHVGSVTQALISQSPIPVLVVPLTEN
jgi:nucleotide-binding universal stress UspA family protein